MLLGVNGLGVPKDTCLAGVLWTLVDWLPFKFSFSAVLAAPYWGWTMDMFPNYFANFFEGVLWRLPPSSDMAWPREVLSAPSTWWEEVLRPRTRVRPYLCKCCFYLFYSFMYSRANFSFNNLYLWSLAVLLESVRSFKFFTFIFLFELGSPSKKFSGNSTF